MQVQVVALVSPGGIAGIKAGVTNQRAQTGFGITHALMGCLYRQGMHAPGATIKALPKLAIECELGITLGDGGKPLVAGPAIELVRADFSRPGDITASNLVATNLAANQFIRGLQHPWREHYETISIKLSRDGEIVAEASLQDSFEGPQSALDWMLPQAESIGLSIEPDTFMMTGTCGKVVPALPGYYVVDYGELGSIDFTIR